MAETTLRSADQAALIKQADTFLHDEPSAQPPTAATLSSLELQQDTALEYDSMVLMSKLEQLAVRLNTTRWSKLQPPCPWNVSSTSPITSLNLPKSYQWLRPNGFRLRC